MNNKTTLSTYGVSEISAGEAQKTDGGFLILATVLLINAIAVAATSTEAY